MQKAASKAEDVSIGGESALRKQDSYTVYRVDSPLPLDGTLTHPAWQQAPKSPAFSDMATGGPAAFDTRAAALWDEHHLYIGFWLEEPYPKAELTERDSIIFLENDVEVFIDGGDCYYEFELNARNTIYEVFFIWRDAYLRGNRFDLPEFDVFGPDAVTFGGDFDRIPATFWRGTHPRGLRWAFLDWDFPGLRSAVHINGTLNDPTVRSKGWTAEIAFPWAGMTHLAQGRSLPPQEGDVWKLFLGRFQNFTFGERTVQAAWCWTPHGLADTHQPERFTPLTFSRQSVETVAAK